MSIRRLVNRIFFANLKSSILVASFLLIFLLFGCLLRKPTETNIQFLWVTKVESTNDPLYNMTDAPIYNLTRTEVSWIHVLLSVLNETLTSSFNDRNEYELTENESEQISLLFNYLFPPKDEDYRGWFVFLKKSYLIFSLSGYMSIMTRFISWF